MASRAGLEIRRATAADAPFIAELMASCGRAVAAPMVAEGLEAIRRDHGLALLADEWGPLSGLIVLHWYSPIASPRMALVSTLLVAPDARRRGVGRLLLKAGSQAARAAGCETLQLIAPPATPDLDGFCQANGFTAGRAGFSRSLRKHS